MHDASVIRFKHVLYVKCQQVPWMTISLNKVVSGQIVDSGYTWWYSKYEDPIYLS